VPAAASSVVLNVTVTDPESSGFLTVYPCGAQVPLSHDPQRGLRQVGRGRGRVSVHVREDARRRRRQRLVHL